jgi:hypothetical protein
MAGGRPPKWKNVEEVQKLIDAYFLSITDDKGEYTEPPTITGLAIALGTTRNTLVDYEEKDEFLRTIKEAKSRCEKWVEQNALMGKANATFSIFNLKNNYGWRDKTESEVNLNVPTPILNGLSSNDSSKEDSEAQ